MDTLHTNDYDITQATSFLVPRGPVLCADELEAWTQGGSMWEIVQRGAKLFGGGGGKIVPSTPLQGFIYGGPFENT